MTATSLSTHFGGCSEGGRAWRAARVSRRARRGSRAGLTLIEVLISVTILALVASLIYGAFDGMSRSRAGLGRINDRYHQGRSALSRMSRELQSAFISAHQPLVISQAVRNTVFWGKDSSTTDRIDFNSFSHRRLSRDAHESDQNELSYFVSRDPEAPGQKMDLVRRESPLLDLEPEKGGVIQVLCEDIESFDVQYLDQSTGEWTDTWDSSQPAAQFGRLPLQVRITLLLRGGIGDQPIKLVTKIPLTMQAPLSFALTDAPAAASSSSGTTPPPSSGTPASGTPPSGNPPSGNQPRTPNTTRPKP
jgi:general secretion pathway protein J